MGTDSQTERDVIVVNVFAILVPYVNGTRIQIEKRSRMGSIFRSFRNPPLAVPSFRQCYDKIRWPMEKSLYTFQFRS